MSRSPLHTSSHFDTVMGTNLTSNGNSRTENGSYSTGRRSFRAFFVIVVLCLCGSFAAHATTYYLSPYGSDSNSGTTTGASWITANHSLNCGDVIVAAAATNYSATNFYTGKWGNVNCPAGNSVAWLTCATFDACKIYTTANQGMWIDKSYWGVSGWEVTTSASDTYGTCFLASPSYSTRAEIHHIIFANDVANGCSQGGFISTNQGSAGVDYFAVLGSIAYNAAQGSNTCSSGISVYQPRQSDSASGTHIYIAGNFSYRNVEPDGCAGRSPTDGEGIILDAFDGSQGGLSPYTAQAVVFNNIVAANGAKGIESNDNTSGSSHATMYFEKNTAWGDLTDTHQSWLGCAEISLYRSSDTHVVNNLISTKSATACGGNPIYALAVSTSDGSDSVTSNFAYGYNGNNTFLYDSGSFSYGSTNYIGTSPNFTNPVAPGAPGCGGTGTVPNCMSYVISDFAPKSGSPAAGYGYQRPSTTSVHDTLYPHWLCTAKIPSGLVTEGCS